MASLLDGPRRGARNGRADALVVLLHGYGANGDDLIALADHWGQALPGAAFSSPDAPTPLPGAPGGRQWFPITALDPDAMAGGVRQAAPLVDAFIDAELARLNVDPRRLIIMGFSQGGMLALHVGPRRAVAPAAVASFSGALCAPDALAAEKTCAPPFLLVHGDADPVVPFAFMFEAGQALARAELGAVWHASPGLPHGIGPDGLEIGAGFFKRALRGARPSA